MVLDLFKAFVKGYLQETFRILTSNEIDSLYLGVLLLPYIQSVRFLTDYLEGDKYFKTKHPEHNLQRAHAQITLLSKLEEQAEAISQIIEEEMEDIKKTAGVMR